MAKVSLTIQASLASQPVHFPELESIAHRSRTVVPGKTTAAAKMNGERNEHLTPLAANEIADNHCTTGDAPHVTECGNNLFRAEMVQGLGAGDDIEAVVSILQRDQVRRLKIYFRIITRLFAGEIQRNRMQVGRGHTKRDSVTTRPVNEVSRDVGRARGDVQQRPIAFGRV